MAEEKEEKKNLQIQCSPSTFVRFKRFAAEFKSYEDALNYLLNSHEAGKAPFERYRPRP